MIVRLHPVGAGARNGFRRCVRNPREIVFEIDVEVPVRRVVAHVVVRVAVLLVLAGADRGIALRRHPGVGVVKAEVVADLVLDGIVAEAAVEPKPDRADTRLAGPVVEDRVEANNVQVVVAIVVFCVERLGGIAALRQQIVVAALRLGLVPRRRLGHPQHPRHQRGVDREFPVRVVAEKLVGAFHREVCRLVVQRVALAVGEINANEQDALFAGGPRHGWLLLGHRPQMHLRAKRLLGGDEFLLPSGSSSRGVERAPRAGQRQDGLSRRKAKRGFLGGSEFAGRLVGNGHLPIEHDAVDRQAALRAKVCAPPLPARR